MGDERTYPLVYSTLSWTASARVRALTLKQIRITTDLIKQLLAFAPSPTLTANAGFDWWNSVGMLLTQLYNLSDSLLDGYREELDIRRLSAGAETEADASLRQAFLGARASALEPFRLVMTNQLAADDSEEESMSIVAGGTGRKQSLHRLAKGHLLKLAEKHMAVDVLIGICEDQGDRVRLEEYMRRYRTSGFVQQLFQWYLTNGNRSFTTRLCGLVPFIGAVCAHLACRCVWVCVASCLVPCRLAHLISPGKRRKLLSLSAEYSQELAQFLQPHKSLLWVHALGMGQYATAASALSDLADQETRFLGKKKVHTASVE